MSEGWSRWWTDKEGNKCEEYWYPGMDRVREVWNGHISYGPYMTFGFEPEDKEKKDSA